MPSTEKISVSIGRDELRAAKRLASRMGLSLSTFITEAVRHRIEAQARREAAEDVLSSFDPEDRASPIEMRELLESWGEARGSRAGNEPVRTRGRRLARRRKPKPD